MCERTWAPGLALGQPQNVAVVRRRVPDLLRPSLADGLTTWVADDATTARVCAAPSDCREHKQDHLDNDSRHSHCPQPDKCISKRGTRQHSEFVVDEQI